MQVRLYMWEALFCCTIDMSIQQFAISALITFLVHRFVAYVRATMGESNISNKTLVDRHFLI